MPPKQAVEVPLGEDGEECVIHITQVALGAKTTDAPAAVSLHVRGKETFVGTLRAGRCDQFAVRAPGAQPAPARVGGAVRRLSHPCCQLDLSMPEAFALQHTGTSTVYVTGWKQTLELEEDDEVSRRMFTELDALVWQAEDGAVRVAGSGVGLRDVWFWLLADRSAG